MNKACMVPDCPNKATTSWPDLCEKHDYEQLKAEVDWEEWKEQPEDEINFADQTVTITSNYEENK
jgi:hypothetical protein